LQHALGEAYRGLLLSGRYPIAFINLAMPPEAVDVNVHPTKIEVRFHDASRHYSQLLSTLRTRFLSSDLHARVRPESGEATGVFDDAETARLREELVGWAKGRAADWSGDVPVEDVADSQPAFALDESAEEAAPLEISRLDRAWAPAGGAARADRVAEAQPVGATPEPMAPRAPAPAAARAMQVHNRYLVAESDDGLLIVDQHALHERILYEQLRERIAASRPQTQSLLVPEPVDLTPAEAAAAIEHRDVLARLGMEVEPFGGNTVLVSGYPAMLANMPPAEVLGALVEGLLSGAQEPDGEAMVDRLLHTIACKAAIKAGDRLAPAEIAALLEQRHLVKDAHHCPHGRPAMLVFTREELDRQFKRM
jgi:DNA mismatch repair protein MutL